MTCITLARIVAPIWIRESVATAGIRRKRRKTMRTVKVQPEKMPEPVSTVLYRSLADAVRRAFTDNNTQKEYEAWKQRRYAGKT